MTLLCRPGGAQHSLCSPVKQPLLRHECISPLQPHGPLQQAFLLAAGHRGSPERIPYSLLLVTLNKVSTYISVCSLME